MKEPVVNAPDSASTPSVGLSLDRVVSTLFESAVEALVKTILVLIFGSIALGIAGEIWRQMTPSAPPGFEIRPEAELTPGMGWSARAAWFNEHVWLILFGIIFAGTLGIRLMRRGGTGEKSRARSRLERLASRLSEEWFGLIVANAFGAMVCAIVLVSVQQFSFSRMVIQWLLSSLLGGIRNIASNLFGTTAVDSMQAWVNWYGANQIKFNFWFFYVAAICDDLGIPNLKSLGRRMGRRARQSIRGSPRA
jgi:hypothetical protein